MLFILFDDVLIGRARYPIIININIKAINAFRSEFSQVKYINKSIAYKAIAHGIILEMNSLINR